MPSYEPTPATIKKLFLLSSLTCGFYDPARPGGACEEVLARADWPRVNAHVCHIKGENYGSARYDPSMTDDERRDFENLLLLCPNHHHLIDDLDPDRYPAEKLFAMKQRGLDASRGLPSWAEERVDGLVAAALLVYRRHLDPPDAPFPVEDYDELKASELLPLLPPLYADELESVRVRELLGQRRPELLKRIDELLEDR